MSRSDVLRCAVFACTHARTHTRAHTHPTAHARTRSRSHAHRRVHTHTGGLPRPGAASRNRRVVFAFPFGFRLCGSSLPIRSSFLVRFAPSRHLRRLPAAGAANQWEQRVRSAASFSHGAQFSFAGRRRRRKKCGVSRGTRSSRSSTSVRRPDQPNPSLLLPNPMRYVTARACSLRCALPLHR